MQLSLTKEQRYIAKSASVNREQGKKTDYLRLMEYRNRLDTVL